jgi:hypothetical protein
MQEQGSRQRQTACCWRHMAPEEARGSPPGVQLSAGGSCGRLQADTGACGRLGAVCEWHRQGGPVDGDQGESRVSGSDVSSLSRPWTGGQQGWRMDGHWVMTGLGRTSHLCRGEKYYPHLSLSCHALSCLAHPCHLITPETRLSPVFPTDFRGEKTLKD